MRNIEEIGDVELRIHIDCSRRTKKAHASIVWMLREFDLLRMNKSPNNHVQDGRNLGGIHHLITNW